MNIFNLYQNYIIPKQEKTRDFKGLCFEALTDTNISYELKGRSNIDIKYSTDGIHWKQWKNSGVYHTGETINLSPTGNIKKIYVKGNNEDFGSSSGYGTYNHFTSTGPNASIKVSGDISSVITDGDKISVTNLPEECYSGIFYTFNALADASELILPGIILGEDCYHAMFAGCHYMTKGPIMAKFTTVNSESCTSMFASCYALEEAPELPATTLAYKCYSGMFYRCYALTTAPELPATTLASSCYENMFRECSLLNYIKLSYIGNFSATYFQNWVNGVAQSGDFYYEGDDTTIGVSAIPTGWTVHKQIVNYNLSVDVNTNLGYYDVDTYTTQLYLGNTLIDEATDNTAIAVVGANSVVDYKIITDVRTEAFPYSGYLTKTIEGNIIVDQDNKHITVTPEFYTLTFYTVDNENQYYIEISNNNDPISFPMSMPWYLDDFPMLSGEEVTIDASDYNDYSYQNTIIMDNNVVIYIGPTSTNLTIVPNTNNAIIVNTATQSWYRAVSAEGQHTFEVVPDQDVEFNISADGYLTKELTFNISEPTTENVILKQANTIWDLNYPYTDNSIIDFRNQIINNGSGNWEIDNEINSIVNVIPEVNDCFYTHFSFTTPNDDTKDYALQINGHNDNNGYNYAYDFVGNLYVGNSVFEPTLNSDTPPSGVEQVIGAQDDSSTYNKQILLEPNTTYYVSFAYRCFNSVEDVLGTKRLLVNRIKLVEAEKTPEPDALCLTSANGLTSSLSYYWSSDDDLPQPNLQYSLNGEDWNSLISDDEGEPIEFTKIYIRGNNLTFGPNGKPGLSKDEYNYSNFSIGGDVTISGNIHALLNNGDGSEITELDDYCFYKLFDGNFQVKNMPELPATVLGDYAYSYMFNSCGITTVTSLPATTVGAHCYEYMFSNNYQLQQAPEMFFTDTPGTDACAYMFNNCVAINYIKMHYTGTLSTAMFTTDWLPSWGSGNFYYNGTETVRNGSTIPSGWTIHTFVDDRYIMLDYIESSGTQYINTNIIPVATMKYQIKYSLTELGNLALFGSRTSLAYDTSKNQIYLTSYFNEYTKLFNWFGNNDLDLHIIPQINTIVETPVMQNQNCVMQNATQPIYIFAFNNKGTAGANIKGKIYYFKIYDNNTNIIANFIPVKRLSDNEIGMLDLVNNTFYTNAGSGSFVVPTELYI